MMSLPMRRTATLFALLLTAVTAAALGHPASFAGGSREGDLGAGRHGPSRRRLGLRPLRAPRRRHPPDPSCASTWSRRGAAEDPQEPDDPAYRWPRKLDIAVQEGAFSGINIAVQVSGSPRWANGGRSSVWSPDRRAFADFLIAAARRYPTVRRWMIWGEPNRCDAYRPNTGGEHDRAAHLRTPARPFVRSAEEGLAAQHRHRGDDLHRGRPAGDQPEAVAALHAPAERPAAAAGLVRTQPVLHPLPQAERSREARRLPGHQQTSTSSRAR